MHFFCSFLKVFTMIFFVSIFIEYGSLFVREQRKKQNNFYNFMKYTSVIVEYFVLSTNDLGPGHCNSIHTYRRSHDAPILSIFR